MIIVYTGNGKGKTTAALGLALRAAGWGKRILIIQFLKKQTSGEINFFKDCQALNKQISKYTNKQIKIKQFGTKDFVDPKKLRPIDFQETKKGFDYSLFAIHNSLSKGKLCLFDIVILDEINVAVEFGLITKEEVLNLLTQKPKEMTIVLTGRWACPEIIEVADLVTEFKEIKHPFKKGEKTRKGIDY